jgi:hypothetical protein
MPSYGLGRLVALRAAQERRAERALAAAVAARARAEAQQAERVAAVGEARRNLDGGRAGARAEAAAGATESAAAALGRQRFRARLTDELAARARALADHRAELLEPALRAEAAAREAYLGARRRREAVEKVAARRESTRRRELDRREEIAVEDRRGKIS